MNEEQAKAALRILGAVARADGKVDDKERTALEQAMTDFGYQVPGTTIESLLSEEVDVDAELAKIDTTLARRSVFEASIAMSLVDGAASEDENTVLARIRTAFELDKSSSLLGEAYNSEYNRGDLLQPILDPELRRKKIDNLRASRAAWAAVLGAIPVPIVGEVGVLMMFDSVSRDIATMWGHPLTRKERIARFGALTSVAMAQVSLNSLLKLVPGWGTAAGAVGGAVFGFMATWAMAKAVNYHFESEQKATAEDLKKVFKEARAEAKEVYAEKKDEIEKAKSEHSDEIAKLSKQLDKKEITVAEFEEKVAALLR